MGNAVLQRIVSGGQTGVDRGALDGAIALGIPHGGWCPRGRLAEDGRIPDRYELRETTSADYPKRTEQNVVDSDGTLIISRGPLSGGTLLTWQLAEKHFVGLHEANEQGRSWNPFDSPIDCAKIKRPCLVVDIDRPHSPEQVDQWLAACGVRVLNVAGPRESQHPGIATQTARLITRLFGQ